VIIVIVLFCSRFITVYCIRTCYVVHSVNVNAKYFVMQSLAAVLQPHTVSSRENEL